MGFASVCGRADVCIDSNSACAGVMCVCGNSVVTQ